MAEQDLAQIEKIIMWDMAFPFHTFQTTVGMAIIDDPKLAIIDDPKYTALFAATLAGDCLGYVAAAWQQIARHKGRRHLTTAEWWEVVSLATNPDDNLRSILADPDDNPKERAHRFLFCVMRQYLRHHRPWWRHPRWHIHHWHIQVHFTQALKRWLFSRCAYCGERFTWGYAPISDGNSAGPRWFKSETHCFHHDCGQANSDE